MESFPPYPIGPGQRALAAIVFTDVVSFSARMEAHEEVTLGLLQRDFTAMKKLCLQHSGSVLKSTGDGLLLYFSSAVQAVACALRMQKYFAKKALTLPANEVLTHRIGIHLGDVFVHDQDVMGDGVNIAARLQAVAEPGGICISQTVYDVVKNKLALQVTKLGARELKNISDAIPIYRILLEAQSLQPGETAAPLETPTATPIPSARPFSKTQILIAAGALGLAVVAVLVAVVSRHAFVRQQAEQSQAEATHAAIRMILETGPDAATEYDRVQMLRSLAGWREELRENRSRAPEEYNFTELAANLRETKAGPVAKTEAPLRQLALARLQSLFGWLGAAMQRYNKERPLVVPELSGTAPKEIKVFAGADRQLYYAEGGAVRQRNWADLKPGALSAIVVAAMLDAPAAPPRDAVQGADIFAQFYGLPEMSEILRQGYQPRTAK